LGEIIIRDVPKSGPSTKDVGMVDESSFQIVHIDKVITLRANSPSDRRQWISMVEGCLAQAEKKSQKDKNQDVVLSDDSRPMIGTLEVRILEAKKLAGSDRIRIRPGVFCVLSLENQIIRSKTSQSWPPKWDQEMMFSVFSLDEALKVQLFNYDRYSKDGTILCLRKFY
jgi:hypothetical protein